MTPTETVRATYPLAFEDPKGTIWESEQLYLENCAVADADPLESDAWCAHVMGWSWEDAAENMAECRRIAKLKAWHRNHPRLSAVYRFWWNRWGFTRLFCAIVWRDYYGRISLSTAWEVARGVWLEGL